ncbi:hypothetical protein BJY01DRAFT_244988 [Aspergillus pseudoustus]|uniref:BZIP domain-containing protein n=1 Tax=Aspergillus pseudoustus TaxID=1810923 RepID=A0ABR4KJL1_9EURO
MSHTISPSDMQRLHNYPPNVPDIVNIGQGPFGLPSTETDMWEPFTTLAAVDPSWTVTSGPNGLNQPFFSNTHRSPLTQTKEGSENYRVQYGQVTPPSDDSPLSNSSLSVHPRNLDNSRSTTLQSSIENQAQRPTKRRRGGPRSRGGSVSGASRGSPSVEPSLSDDDKQEKTRARNRVAASKCRQKQKARNMELENECNFQEARKQELSREAARLRDEVVKQKNLLLAHSECGHNGIKQYLDNMVKRITTGVGEAPDFGRLVEGCAGSGPSVETTQQPSVGSSDPAWGFGFDGYAPTV